MRCLSLIIPAGLFWIGLSGCTPTDSKCTYGVLPYNGQTAVALDSRIVFQSPEALPNDLPALSDDVAALHILPEDEAVSVEWELDLDNQTVILSPKEGLLEHREYRATGVMNEGFDSSNYYAGHDAPHAVETRFKTWSSPTALFAVATGEVDGTTTRYAIVFSEPMALDSFAEESVTFLADGATFASTLFGYYNDLSYIVVFDVTPTLETAAAQIFQPVSVHIAPDVMGVTGVHLNGDQDDEDGEEVDEQYLEISDQGLGAYLGEGTCE